MEYLLHAQSTFRIAPSQRVALESILLKVLRIHQRIPVDVLVRRLFELEQKLTHLPNELEINCGTDSDSAESGSSS